MNLQTQPTPVSCTQTCLAMILDVPVAEVLKVYPEPMGQYELVRALTECSVLYNVISAGRMCFAGYYLLTVPSLNTRGANHQIIVELPEEGGGWKVFDPNTGRPNISRYTPETLKTWCDPVRVMRGGCLPRPDPRTAELEKALADAISTYDPEKPVIHVTAERQEAWIAVLKGKK